MLLECIVGFKDGYMLLAGDSLGIVEGSVEGLVVGGLLGGEDGIEVGEVDTLGKVDGSILGT